MSRLGGTVFEERAFEQHIIKWMGAVALAAAILMIGLILLLNANGSHKQLSISEPRPPHITNQVQFYSRYGLAVYECSGIKAHDACFYQRMIAANSDQPLVQQFYRERLASLYVAGPPLQLDPRIIRP